VNLEIARGDFVAAAGPSGSGKTTIMNLIGLIDRPSAGTVFIDGRDTGALNDGERTALRRSGIGFVFQSFNLLPVLNVFETVELPLLLGKKRPPAAERREWTEHLLEQVGLADRRNHLPAELSGGQQQRAAIARALVTKPPIVIADEPTANLDSANGERVLALMRSMNAEYGTTFIFSTHDSAIYEMAGHVIFLRDGHIERERHQS
jgi:putative ABC transport system ATP-binding protein